MVRRQRRYPSRPAGLTEVIPVARERLALARSGLVASIAFSCALIALPWRPARTAPRKVVAPSLQRPNLDPPTGLGSEWAAEAAAHSVRETATLQSLRGRREPETSPDSDALRCTPAAPTQDRSVPESEFSPAIAHLKLLLVDQAGGTLHRSAFATADLEVRRLDGDSLSAGSAQVIRLPRAQSDGGFAVAVPPGRLELVLWTEHQVGGPALLELEPGEELELSIALRDALAVGGLVLEAETGQPIRGARVRFWTFSEEDAVVTGAEGHFNHPRFPVGPNLHQVRVDAPGFGATVRYFSFDESGSWALYSNLAGPPQQSGRDGRPWIEISLQPASRLSGRVVNREGQPIANAEVLAEGYLFSLDGVATRDSVRGRSDSRGHFVLEGLRADIGHGLRIHAPGYGVSVREVSAGDHNLGTLVLEPGRLVSGTVLDADGLPRSDVAVDLIDVSSAPPQKASEQDAALRLECTTRRTRTDKNGVFAIEDAAQGKLRVRLVIDGKIADEQTIEGGDATFLVLQTPPLPPRGGAGGQPRPSELAFRGDL